MEGYTTIKINGQEIGLLFGLYAIERIFAKLGGMTVEMSEGRRSATLFKHILYSGYLCDCEAMDTFPVLTARDFQVYIEQCAKSGDMTPVTDAVAVYNKSTAVKEPEAKSTDEKKNQ